MPALALGSLVGDNVRACLCSWRKLKPTDDNRLLARNWNLSPRVFGSMCTWYFASCACFPS